MGRLKASKKKTRKLKNKILEDMGLGLIHMKGGYTTILVQINTDDLQLGNTI